MPLQFGGARWALLLLIAVLPVLFNPFADFPSEPLKVTVFRWAVLGLFVLAVAKQRGRTELALPRNAIGVAVSFYAVALVLATLFSIDPSLSFWGGRDQHGLLTWFALWAFCCMVASAARDVEWTRGVVDALLISTVPVCLYGLVQFAGFDPLDWVTDSVSDMTSTLGRSNYVGAYAAAVAPFALHRLYELRGKGRSLSSSAPALALVALQVSVIFFSQARAAWLGLIVGTAVFAGIEGHQKGSRKRWWVAAILAGGVLVGVASFGAQRLQTVASRWSIWVDTLALVPEHPVLGYGPETFETVFPSSEYALIVDDPHNVLLDHLVSTGMIGLGAFCLLIGVFVRQVQRGLRAKGDGGHAFLAAIAGSAAAYLVQAQFNPDVIVLTLIFWLNLGLVAAPSSQRGR